MATKAHRAETLPQGRSRVEVIHLGTEVEADAVEAIRLLRQESKFVSMVGMGTSMEPFIEDGTRMVFEPYDGRVEPIKVGAVYMTVVPIKHKVLLDTHLVVEVDDSDDTFLTGSPQGWLVGWCHQENVIGRYVGDWKVLRKRGIRYTDAKGVSSTRT